MTADQAYAEWRGGFPKDPPVIDPAMCRAIRFGITRCEFPEKPRRCPRGMLELAHIRARGMGGARRKDTRDNLAMLCREHHHYFDQVMGQSADNQVWLARAVADGRTPEENRRIDYYYQNAPSRLTRQRKAPV